MVLSKGHEMVRPGYPRLSGDVARAADRGDESGNPNRVGRVCREYDMDQRIDRVTRDNQEGYLGQWVDQVTQDSRGNRDGGSVQ
jgi:hypothetical protein